MWRFERKVNRSDICLRKVHEKFLRLDSSIFWNLPMIFFIVNMFFSISIKHVLIVQLWSKHSCSLVFISSHRAIHYSPILINIRINYLWYTLSIVMTNPYIYIGEAILVKICTCRSFFFFSFAVNILQWIFEYWQIFDVVLQGQMCMWWLKKILRFLLQVFYQHLDVLECKRKEENFSSCCCSAQKTTDQGFGIY